MKSSPSRRPRRSSTEGGVLRARQDHRPHHRFRCRYRRDRAVRRAAGEDRCLLHAALDRGRPTPTPSSRSTRSRCRARSAHLLGSMFAASPGLHSVEHPIYDIWLTDCARPETVVAAQPEAAKPALAAGAKARAETAATTAAAGLSAGPAAAIPLIAARGLSCLARFRRRARRDDLECLRPAHSSAISTRSIRRCPAARRRAAYGRADVALRWRRNCANAG